LRRWLLCLSAEKHNAFKKRPVFSEKSICSPSFGQQFNCWRAK
jgi:hypothetical protein